MPRIRIEANTLRRAVHPDTRARMDDLPDAFRAQALAERLVKVRDQMKAENVRRAIDDFAAAVKELDERPTADEARRLHAKNTNELLSLIELVAQVYLFEPDPTSSVTIEALITLEGEDHDLASADPADHDPATDLTAQPQEA